MRWRRVVAVAAATVAAVSFGPTAARSASTYTIFSSTEAPAMPAVTDGVPIELGVRFQADVSGVVTALRFYKGAANVGTHVGHLWTATGMKLAEATFTGETASGWQQVQLAQPVAIAANTPYIASYWSQSGYFADTWDYFTSGVDNVPLHAPASTSSALNGVYAYGSGGFPSSSYRASNYWVDVVFTPSASDTTAPTVSSVSPADGTTGVDVGSSVTARFDEPIDPSTVTDTTFTLRDQSGVGVAASVGYSAATATATLIPHTPLAYGATYVATVRGGATGVKDTSGNALVQDQTWSFRTAATPPPTPDEGPGGPILVVRSSADAFSSYLAEILRTEGLQEFQVTDVSNLTASTLSAYQLVVLGHVPLSDAQVSTLTTWVQAGGKLIAMRPDAKLGALLGLTSSGSTVGDGYVRIDTASSPGKGITGATMQFHGTADRYAASSGTRTVATLYTDATTATTSPAVTLRSVGTNGGEAAAFTYDLARSVVYTHQGNPAWAGQERDHDLELGSATIRSDDLFYGGTVPDYVDFSKILIPQADEQQRLLANLVTDMESDRMPVPRLWYLPNGRKAVVVMTGDAHPNGMDSTSFAFDRFISQSPANCSVVDWTCIRATSYLQQDVPLDPAKAKSYEDMGFEVALHLRVPGIEECNNFTSYDQLKGVLDAQLYGTGGFLDTFPLVTPPQTIRTHCIVWSDWDSEVRADLSDGIRLNTDYYYWPPAWVLGRPGMFTGEGIPMRYAALNGSVYDVFQATTQLPDETFATYAAMSTAVSALLDGALGSNGYYGAFTANVHNDSPYDSARVTADAIVDAAKARGVAIISARQLLTWLDGRDDSSFQQLGFANGQLRFTMVVGAGARGLQAMLPVHGPNGDLQTVTRAGQAVTFTRTTVKGVDYAVVPATAAAYVATYGTPSGDTTPPVISGVSASASSDGTATVGWLTNEASSSRVDYGTSPTSLTLNVSSAALVSSHSVSLSGLTPGVTYSYRVTSVDAAGNSASSAVSSFTVPSAAATGTIVHSSVADFAAGTTAGTFVGASGSGTDGEVQLAPALGEEFPGTALPSGWTITTNNSGGTATVSNGALIVDGVRFGTSGTYAAGRQLEFYGTLSNTTLQHVGFSVTLNSQPWAIFSTGDGSVPVGLYARTRGPSGNMDTLISGVSPAVAHRYRIVWTAASVTYWVDGAQVASHAVAITAAMRPMISDWALGGSNPVVYWLRLGPVAATGTFTSPVLDGGSTVDWLTLEAVATIPSGTQIAIETRSGATSTPDASWSAWQAIGSGSSVPSPNGRYLQYRATLTTGATTVTPSLESVTITYRSP